MNCRIRWKSAYKQFMGVNALVLIVVVLSEWLSVPNRYNEPKFVIRKTFVTSQCEDGRRLGNLMFNYASLIGIAHRYNATPLISENFPLLDMFPLTAAQSSNVDNSLGMYRNYEEYGKRACGYDIQTEHFAPPVLNTKLHGYYQSWKYFKSSNDVIRKEFVFKHDIYQTALQFHASLNTAAHGATRVAIHVRRGDVLDPDKSNYGYTTPDVSYYIKAMRIFTETFTSVIFVICSDDIEWARDNIQSNNVYYSTSMTPAVDLAIIALCDHVIMSVGSYGWWGAFLANGITIYYDNWPRPVSMLEYMVTKKDYFLPDWIGVYEKTNIDEVILKIKSKQT